MQIRPQWDITSHMAIIKKGNKQQVLARIWRIGKPHVPLVRMLIGAIIMENSMEVPQKIKNRTNVWQSNSTSEHISKENENRNGKRYMHHYVHYNICAIDNI